MDGWMVGLARQINVHSLHSELFDPTVKLQVSERAATGGGKPTMKRLVGVREGQPYRTH